MLQNVHLAPNLLKFKFKCQAQRGLTIPENAENVNPPCNHHFQPDPGDSDPKHTLLDFDFQWRYSSHDLELLSVSRPASLAPCHALAASTVTAGHYTHTASPSQPELLTCAAASLTTIINWIVALARISNAASH